MIIQTLQDISRLLTRADVPYMVMGGQAVAVYGEPRFTQDIDITVALAPDEAGPLREVLAVRFLALPEDVDTFIRETWVLPLEHRETRVRVDIVFSVTPFERDAIAGANTIDVEGVPVRYIPPAHLVVQKIIAGRARDQEDAASVMRVQSGTLTPAKVESILKELARGAEKGKEWLARWRSLKKELHACR